MSLVTAQELRRALRGPKITVVDCRFDLADPTAGRAAYAAGHLPTAVYLSLDEDLSDLSIDGAGRHPLPSPGRFAATLARVGIEPDHRVVVYDDRGGALAARAWWMLRALGIEAAVLDGGLPAWLVAGGESTTDVPATRWVDPMPVPEHWPGTADRAMLRRLSGRVVVDARAPERYRGEEEPLDPVAGHVPGAVNLPYAELLDDRDHLLPPDVLAARFRAVGITTGSDPVVYCGSGVTSCLLLLALEVAGLGGGTLFPGSWSEWCAAGEAVERTLPTGERVAFRSRNEEGRR